MSETTFCFLNRRSGGCLPSLRFLFVNTAWSTYGCMKSSGGGDAANASYWGQQCYFAEYIVSSDNETPYCIYLFGAGLGHGVGIFLDE